MTGLAVAAAGVAFAEADGTCVAFDDAAFHTDAASSCAGAFPVDGRCRNTAVGP